MSRSPGAVRGGPEWKLQDPDPRAGALTELGGILSQVEQELSADLDGGSAASDLQQCREVVRRQVRLEELRRLLDTVRRTGETEPIRSAVHLPSQDTECKELREELAALVPAKMSAEREAAEIKVAWKSDRIRIHQLQQELQMQAAAVSEAASSAGAKPPGVQQSPVADIQLRVWQTRCASQEEDLQQCRSRCSEWEEESSAALGRCTHFEAYAMETAKAEAQLSLQTQILTERCIELQAKMDRSKVTQYDLFGQLEQLRIQNLEQHQHLEATLAKSEQLQQENRNLEASSADLELQLAECMLCKPSCEPPAQRDRVKDLHSLERRYAVSEAARDGCARRLKLLETQQEKLQHDLQVALTSKQDLAEKHKCLRLECENFESQLRLAERDASSSAKHRDELAQEHWQHEKGASELLEKSQQQERAAEEFQRRFEDMGAALEAAILAKERMEARAVAAEGDMKAILQDGQWNQSAKTPPPDVWLEEDAALPEEYLELKGAIDVSGWGAVEWAGNYTLLHWAAATNHAGLCEHFLRLRADPLVRDDAGRTSLDYAVLHQHKEVAMVMINAVATDVQRPEASVVRAASVEEKAEMSGNEPAYDRFVLLLRRCFGSSARPRAPAEDSMSITAWLVKSARLRQASAMTLESFKRADRESLVSADSLISGRLAIVRDEYGDLFEDYGFLKRAEAFKGEGNKAFAKERFEKALAEYDDALEQLLTVAYDKSIVIGKKKWNDIVVMRSTLHLNKSTCFYKLKDWQQSLDAALECLVGNHRDEMLFTDPHIRHKLKESERKSGHAGATLVEFRLPRITRAKAWFRASQCYGHLDFLDKAKDALAKALEACDDQGLIAEISQHSLRLDTLERLQKDKQKKQFAGFWDKFQDRGGYSEGKNDVQEWDKLKYWERFKHVEEYEERYSYVDQDQQQEDPKRGHAAELLHHLPPGAKWDSAVKGLTKKMYRSIDRSFEEYLEKKSAGQVEESSVTEEPGQSPRIEVPPEPKDVVPPRPRRKEETPLAYSPRGARPGARSRAARSPSPVPNAREEYARHYNSYAKQEKAWQDKAAAEALDSEEEQELQEADPSESGSSFMVSGLVLGA
ncbi:unnamed protein product [Symbiodinium sp. CCMP2456]|nr:unnamed protein product [Symbiodinium sp. CCMP2456]